MTAIKLSPSDRLADIMPHAGDNEAVGAWSKAWLYIAKNGPQSDDMIRRIAGPGWERVAHLFTRSGDTWSTDWIDETRKQRARISATNSRNGKLGGLAKPRPARKASKRQANGKRTVSERLAVARMEEKTEEKVALKWPTWGGAQVLETWERFKAHRMAEHKAKYKSPTTEQRAIDILAKYFKSGKECVVALEYSIGRNWAFPVDPAQHTYPKYGEGEPAKRGATDITYTGNGTI